MAEFVPSTIIQTPDFSWVGATTPGPNEETESGYL